jgi:hypothetical protein
MIALREMKLKDNRRLEADVIDRVCKTLRFAKNQLSNLESLNFSFQKHAYQSNFVLKFRESPCLSGAKGPFKYDFQFPNMDDLDY